WGAQHRALNRLPGESVGAGGAQPRRGEVVEALSAGAPPRVEEVVHGRVAVVVTLQVVDDTGEEDVVTHPGVQLLQDARALGVGDAVEVLQCGGSIGRAVPGDGMGAGAL